MASRPFSTYPEDRDKLLDLARKCERSDDANAIELGDLVRAILEDEAAAEEVGWIEWSGGKCPVSSDARVQVKYRDAADALKGERIEWPMKASDFAWWHDGQEDDIMAYRVVSK